MAGLLTVNPEQVQATAGQIQGQAGELESLLGTLNGLISSLDGDFTGQASVAFNNTYSEWRGGMTQIQTALADLGRLLNQAGITFSDTDTGVASTFAV